MIKVFFLSNGMDGEGMKPTMCPEWYGVVPVVTWEDVAISIKWSTYAS